MITLVIDHREEMNSICEERLESIKKNENFVVERAHLEVGDILIKEKNAIIEVKDVADFYGSIISGHMFEQAINMRNNYEGRSFIMIVGNWDKLIKGMKKFNQREAGTIMHICYGAEMSLVCKYGIPVIRCDTPSEFAKKLEYLAEKVGEAPEVKDIVKMNFTYEQRWVSMLTAIQGIGKNKAKAIAAKYPNLRAFVCADEKSLQEIDGIGKKLSAEIMVFINGKN